MDKKEGFGTLYMSNGDKLSGSFNNDFVEGFGTFTILASNKNVNGVWSKNIFRK